MVAEVAGGVLSNSLALLADAGHMLTDSAAVALALFASWIAGRPATAERTFGYLRLEIIAALLNGTVLIGLAGLIVWQAVGRFVGCLADPACRTRALSERPWRISSRVG
jgi:cobalt-zinc-cadmium efflux system protein